VIPVIMFGNLFPRHSCTGVLIADIVADAVAKNIMRRLILPVILLLSKKEEGLWAGIQTGDVG